MISTVEKLSITDIIRDNVINLSRDIRKHYSKDFDNSTQDEVIDKIAKILIKENKLYNSVKGK